MGIFASNTKAVYERKDIDDECKYQRIDFNSLAAVDWSKYREIEQVSDDGYDCPRIDFQSLAAVDWSKYRESQQEIECKNKQQEEQDCEYHHIISATTHLQLRCDGIDENV